MQDPPSTSAEIHPLPPHLDPLTQVLDGMHLRCLVPSAHQMTAPWGLRFGGVLPNVVRRQLDAMGLPGPPRGTMIAIIHGSCCLEMEQHGVRLPLSDGDVMLVPNREPFVLRDDWRTPVRDVQEIIRPEHVENLLGLRYGGGGVPTTLLTGAFVSEDDEDHPLLSVLPPVIRIRASELGSVPWLESTLRFLSSELTTRLPGSQSIINHLAQLLFVQAVRAYAASLPDDSTANWCRALFDRELSPALGLMHSHPERPWTVASLGEQAGIGRSAFAARFTASVGRPPLQYLTHCRMRKARAMLRDTNLGIKSIATKVGYSNESAFSQAFKRTTGVSPGAYRHAKRISRRRDSGDAAAPPGSAQ